MSRQLPTLAISLNSLIDASAICNFNPSFFGATANGLAKSCFSTFTLRTTLILPEANTEAMRTSPLRVKAQYDKNVGNPVEVLTADGRKLKGELKEAGDTDFTIVVSRKVKPEGAKRPVMVDEDVTLKYDEIKYTKYLIEF